MHLVGLVLDSYVVFGWRELFIPFASEWEPEAVAWGIVALYILLTVQGTSLAMKRLPRRLWRWVHFTSFGLFFTAAIHGAYAGTDATSMWYRAGSVAVILTAMVVALYRIMTKRSACRSESARTLEQVA
jgi:hypothetical protein